MIRRLLVIGGCALVAALAVGWFTLYGGDDRKTCPSRDRVLVVVPKGAPLGTVADILQRRGVISGTTRFQLRVRLEGDAGRVHAGPILMCRHSSYGEALHTLVDGGNATTLVTIPEGPSRSEVAPIVARAGVSGSYARASSRSPLLDPATYGAPAGASLDGFLFPSTYDLPLHPNADQLVAAQLKAFKQAIGGVDMSLARSKNLTTYDVLNIAAMVERETAAPVERPMVAAVIWNRLKQRMPLGIDATTRYQFDNWTRPLKVSELSSDSPWNTRRHAGLPPGPIGNPGLASIRAAAAPASTDALFYVVKPWTCGRHTFAATQAEFDRAVAAYESARSSNGGRAPTKCN